MTKLNSTFFTLIFVLFSFYCSGQNEISKDSLKIFNQLTRGFKLVYSQPNQAQTRIDSAINYATKINYPYGKMKAFNVMGIVCDVKGKNDSAISFYRKSIAIAVRLNNNLSKAQTYNNVGLIYWNQHALDSALWYYKEAAEIFKNENNNKGLANNYNNLGLIYDDLSLDTVSKNYFIQALTIYKQLADTFGIGATLANLGRVYFNSPDSAIKYNKQAIPFMEKSNDQYGLSRVYNNLAGSTKEKNLFQEAVDYYKLSLKVKETTKDLYGIASTHNNIYAAYETFASIDDLTNIGLIHLKKAKKIAEKEEYTRLLLHLYGNFTNYYVRISNYDSAYKYENKRFLAYKNVFNSEKEETIRELEVEFDVERKRNQIKVLKQEKEIEILASQKRKSIIFILLISLLLIIGFGLFYFINYKNKQKLKHQKVLVSEKEKGLSATIEATENERIRIAKDLHDGVGQQLAALKLQFGGMQKKLIDNTSADIRNISHQMMPKTLQEFGLINAVDQLLESTLKSSPINFKFEYFGFEERVSKKIEIAIYRILQELVKNVIVHSSANLLNVQLIKNQKNIVLIVEDNGVGFSKSKKSDGIGLLSLKSRVSDIHGEINFEPSPNSGTLVTARIPIS